MVLKKKRTPVPKEAKAIVSKEKNEEEPLFGIESDYDEDVEEADKRLSKLVETVTALGKEDDGKRKVAKRTEPSVVMNEFGLIKDRAAGEKVQIHELLNSVKDKTGKIRKQIRKITHKQLISAPLETAVAKQLARKVHFEETAKEVSKWEPVVKQNREKPQIEFPLEKPSLELESPQNKTEQFKSQTPLEREVNIALGKSEHVLKQDRVLTPAEEKYLKAMSVEEARERHRHLQRMRALLSYQETKLKRKAKIKSKKYHRLLKKEKLRKEMKDFEQAKNADPSKALDKLAQLDKLRALERASLRHKNTGKWSKHNQLRSKYDKTARDAMIEQLKINEKLTSRPNFEIEDSESDEKEENDLDEGEVLMGASEYDDNGVEENPWLKRSSLPKSRTSLISSASVIEEIEDKQNGNESGNQSEDEQSNFNESSTLKVNLSKKKLKNGDLKEEIKESSDKRKRKNVSFSDEVISKDLNGSAISEESSKKSGESSLIEKTNKEVEETLKKKLFVEKTVDKTNVNQDEKEKKLQIDPSKILHLKTNRLKTMLPDLQEMGTDDESTDEEMIEYDDKQRQLIAEAFAEDDVVAEFVQNKKDMKEQEGSKDICLYMPGWGSWAGPGLQENKKLKKKLTIKGRRRQRRDDKLTNVIISETKDAAISKFLVKELPYKVKDVSCFEEKMKKPVGHNWNSETLFRYNIEPRVITHMGKVIEPITEKALIKKPENRRRPLEEVAKTLGDVVPL